MGRPYFTFSTMVHCTKKLYNETSFLANHRSSCVVYMARQHLLSPRIHLIHSRLAVTAHRPILVSEGVLLTWPQGHLLRQSFWRVCFSAIFKKFHWLRKFISNVAARPAAFCGAQSVCNCGASGRHFVLFWRANSPPF